MVWDEVSINGSITHLPIATAKVDLLNKENCTSFKRSSLIVMSIIVEFLTLVIPFGCKNAEIRLPALVRFRLQCKISCISWLDL